MYKIDKIVIELIKNAMEYKNVSVSQLSEKTGLKPAQITTALNGNIRLSFDVGVRMAVAMNVELGPLLKVKIDAAGMH